MPPQRGATPIELSEDTIPWTVNITHKKRSTSFALSVTKIKLNQYRQCREWNSIQQSDHVIRNNTKYHVGDAVNVKVGDGLSRVRLEPAAITECRDPYVLVVWLYGVQEKKRILEGKVAPGCKLALSTHADIVHKSTLRGHIIPMEQVSMSIVLLLGPRERVIYLQGFGDKNNSGCCYMRDLAKNVTARLSSASQVPQSGYEEESQPTLNLSNNKRSVQITEPTSDWSRSTPRPGEDGEEPTTLLESFTSSTKSNTSRNKRRRISEEKVAVSACPKIFPTERTSPTKGLGNLLREHRSRSTLPTVSIDPATVVFDNNDGEIRNDAGAQQHQPGKTPTQIRRVASFLDVPDSRPATPQIPFKDPDPPPPKAESQRKGVSFRGITRPAEVNEYDWMRKSGDEKRRLWHVYRIASETYGRRAPHACQQCSERGKDCRQYKDGVLTSQLQCLNCTYAKRGCSFVLKAKSEEVPGEETQPADQVWQHNTSTPFASELRPSWDTVIWVTFRDNYPFHKSNTLAIQCFPEDRLVLGKDPWLVEANETGLGDVAVKVDDGGIYVHQGLATMLAARALSTSFPIRLHDWTWLTGQLHGNDRLSTFSDGNGQPQNAVIFIHATTEQPSNMTEVFEYLRELREIYDVKVRPYPSETEWSYDQRKIGDIRALDRLAQSTDQPEYSYRPRTCFGQEPCPLQDCEKTVHKRLHSEGGRHVKVLGQGICSALTSASEPPQQPRRQRTRSTRPYWFHQEFVPLLSRGEFRVLISTKPDGSGIRGRSGYVVAMAWTSWTSSDPATRELAVSAVDENDFGGSAHSKCGPLGQSDLERFCLYVFEKLRGRNSPCYESLEVGARMDVGVAHDRSQTFFFVNEVTRWYNAHFFSHNLLPEPKTKICKAFATAFVSYVHDGMHDVIH